MTLQLGSTREVWFSKVAASGTKWSFILRDDAFSKSGQSFGRTIRLGDPIDTGNASGWKQTSWEGGNGQLAWRDHQMFKEGSVDPKTHPGRIRMWPGFQSLGSHASRTTEGYILCHGADGSGVDTPLWMGETARIFNTAPVVPNPGGGFALLRYNPTTNQIAVVNFFAREIQSMMPLTSDDGSAQWMHVTTQDGGYWMVQDDGLRTPLQDTNALFAPFAPHSLVAFGGATYYCQANWLGKRVALPPYYVTGTHSKVKEIKGAQKTRGLCVWQNRLWFGVQFGAGHSVVYTSDGVTANQAFVFEDEFVIQNMISHFGSLYLAGYKPVGLYANGTIAQVWKYTGSSLTKLWEEGDGRDGKNHMAVGMATDGHNLVWTRGGWPSAETVEQPWPNKRPGLMYYDASKDALFEGPGLDMDPASAGYQLTDVASYNNTLVVSAYDLTSYGVSAPWPSTVLAVRDLAQMRHNIVDQFATHSFAVQPTIRTQQVTSSEYTGPPDVYDEKKVWLSVRVRYKLPIAGAQLRVVALLDGSTTELAVGTITATGPNWQLVTLSMKNAGDYLSSASIQYRLYLENIAGGTTSTAQVEVDAIEVKWQLVPTKQRTWHMRLVCTDAQLRLNGTANPLTTAQTMADKLEELWGLQVPFNLYEPQASGGGPSNPAIEVTATNLNIHQYRLSDQSAEVVQEVTVTLSEVVL